MAVLDLILSAILSAVVTIPSMLVLYHKWIIPKILLGVKAELPPAILSIVDEKIQDVKDYIGEQVESARAAIRGKAGNNVKLANLAARFLEKNGVTPETLDTVAEKYGEDILAALQKRAATANGSVNDPFGKISE